jgi:uncharacterized protein YyaL (SSP411 family)
MLRAMANRLSEETSPYLLQHAHNPVDWFPWGAEAFERAQSLDRPVLLSVGYSACHWCHVMERESFDDPETAALMNGLFVSIKVDREERPDVDAIYMKAVQAMTGQGGWPLTAVLTPDGAPFFGGTYFPPDPRHGMASAQVRRILERSATVPESEASDPETGTALIEGAHRFMAARFDPVHGGFGPAPKFPQPAVLDFLLGHGVQANDEQSLTMALHTLRCMARGGMRDQLDGGFHRYSVDARWLVPHFEKMLYDNALLARVYLHAWQITGEELFRRVTSECLTYVLSDLGQPEGGFYSARDADSEGEEGLFYLWTPSQVEAVLGGEETALFNRFFDVSDAGNFEGSNILHRPHDLEAVAQAQGLETEALLGRLDEARGALREDRASRVPPFRDEKVLSGWTAMTVRALAEAGGAMDVPEWTQAAARSARFVLDAMRDQDRLLHTFMAGTARIPGFLEDYAALGNALMTLHEATLDPAWLEECRWVCDRILDLFVDAAGIPYDTAVDAERLLIRPRETMDNATPSGTSLTAELMLRAGVVFDDDRYRSLAEGILARGMDDMERYPLAFGRLLAVLESHLGGAVEVAIVGPRNDPDTQALLATVLGRFLPHRVLVGGNGSDARAHPAIDDAKPAASEADPTGTATATLPLLAGRFMVDGNPTAFVCRDYACQAPVTAPEALADQLP